MCNKLFTYSGSKSKYLDIILPLIDGTKVLIEPFLGSGAVLLNAPNSFKIGSDLNSRIIDIFVGFKNSNYDEYVRFLNRTNPKFIKKDKVSYYEFRNYYNPLYESLQTHEQAFYQWICIQSCVNGMARWGKTGFNQGFGSRTYNEFSRTEFDAILSSVRDTTFKSTSFFNLAEEDNCNVVWFLDPSLCQ